MAKSSVNLDFKQVHPHTQAKNPVLYEVLQHESNEFKELPLDNNLLEFSDKRIQKRLIEFLYFEPLSTIITKEFRYNLLVFYLYLLITAVIIVLSVASLYNSNILSYNSMIFHVICVLIILSYSILVLILVLKVKFFQYNNRIILCSLGCIWCLYLVLSNQRILYGILSEEKTDISIQFSLATIGFIYYFRMAVFDSFKHVLIPTVLVLTLQIIISFLISNSKATEVLSEYSLMGVVLVLQLIESQKVTSRTLQLFFRYYTEQQIDVYNDENMSNNFELISNNELVVDKCERVIKEIKFTRSSIMYNDLKLRLKSCIVLLKDIKKFLGKYGSTDTINFADNSQIDIEDKEFISQNFLTVNVFKSRAKERPGTLKDFINKKERFSFSIGVLAESVNILQGLGKIWNFDILNLSEKYGSSVSLIGKYLYNQWFLDEMLKTNQNTAFRFFEHIEINYQNNPYHNAAHAADVFNSLYYFILHSDIDKVVTPLESIACLIASIGHDIGHPGLTNRYLVASRHALSLRYNDNSVLENMHCSMIYTILTEPECNILNELTSAQWTNTRKLIIEMVLFTDMSRHFELLGKFRTRAVTLNDLNLENIEDKIFVLSIGLKCADIGHSAKEFDLHEKWTLLICEEFFNQGDLEKKNNMPVSMYCDRENADVPKSQGGFLRSVCLPLFEVFATFLQAELINKECVEQIKANATQWEEKIKEKGNLNLVQKAKDDFMVKIFSRVNE